MINSIATVTVWLIFLAVVVVTGYDLFVVTRHGASASISWTILTLARAYPIIPLAVGTLLGHLFWPQFTDPAL
jgi:hypothetical protein